ncbi:hypothetical protein GCM10027299_44040 [Larkinella ripae]
MPAGYFQFDEQGTLVSINRTLLTQLGYNAPEVTGRSIESLLTIASRIFYQTHFYPLLKLQGKADEIFLSLRMKSGGSLPVLLNASRIKPGDSPVYQCICMAVHQRQKYEEEILRAKHLAEQALRENKELAEAKQALERHQQLLDHQLVELQQKNQELWQFGKLITHDLQEPLRKIALLADVLREDVRENLLAEDRRLLDRIIEASENMRELIRRLREYLLLEAAPHRFTAVDLQQVMKEAETRVSQQFETDGIQLTTEGLPRVEGDPRQLIELFVQLMKNSVQFRTQPGQVAVELTVAGQLIEHNGFRAIQGKYRYEEFVRITYRDNGPGIEAGLSDKLFQIHKKPSAGFLGLGFGLAICKKIVANHGGVISVNTSGRAGAQFTILLPVRQP